MEHSRRSRIVDLLIERKDDTEILALLDKEFLCAFSTSNTQALAGTKWDFEGNRKGVTRKKSVPSPKLIQRSNAFDREQLIIKLRSFQSAPIIERYRQRDLAGKSPRELLSFTVDNKIYRAFHHETPSLHYMRWRWHRDAELLYRRLIPIKDQEMFDRFALR